MTGFAAVGLNKGFKLLETWRQKIWFSLIMLIGLSMLVMLFSETRPKPELFAIINSISISRGTPPTAVATVTIYNSGNMQSIVRGISLETSVDGRTYAGVPTTVPDQVTVRYPQTSVVYQGRDSLFVRGSIPIAPGGEIDGVALFVFHGAPSTLGDRPNTLKLLFHDVSGRRYERTIETTLNASVPTMELPGVSQKIIPNESNTNQQKQD